jgi:hypothetical protein
VRGVLLFAIVLATAIAVGAWRGSFAPGAQSDSSICSEPSTVRIGSPILVGHVRQSGTHIRLLGVRRDASTTIARMCIEGGGMPARAPYAIDGPRTLRSAGMLLARRGDAISATLVYPPSESKKVTFLLPAKSGSQAIGSAEFANSPPGACSLRASAPFTVSGCGSVLYLRWQAPWHIAPNRIGVIDIRPHVRTPQGPRRLEFYLYRVSSSTGGQTVIDFAIPRTAANVVRLDVPEIDLIRPTLAIHPHPTAYYIHLTRR